MRNSLLCAGALFGVCLTACGDDGERSPARNSALVLDPVRGTFRGVEVGDSTEEVIRVNGKPGARGPDAPDVPIGEDTPMLTNYGSPKTISDTEILKGRRDFETLRYRHRVYGMTGGRLTSIGITGSPARTSRGVGIGDSQAVVKDRYPKADCFVQNEDSEYQEYPICRIRVCDGRLLGIAGDPVVSMTLAAETRSALTRCAHRKRVVGP
jgi:hypothetical protein